MNSKAQKRLATTREC